MDSDTSIEDNDDTKINIKSTSNTDYYLQNLANPEKIIIEQKILDSDSESIKLESSSESQHSEKKPSKKISKKISKKSSEKNTKPDLTPYEIRKKKNDLLRKLSELKEKGYTLSRDYSLNDELVDMEYEYELLEKYAHRKNGTSIAKKFLLNAIHLIEYANTKYDPFNFQLLGWTEHMSVEIDTYDDVIGQLIDKYGSNGINVPPELKLIGMVILSGAAFHLSKNSGIPGLDKILKENPNILANLTKKEESRFVSPQELNIINQQKLNHNVKQPSRLVQNILKNNKSQEILKQLDDEKKKRNITTEMDSSDNDDRLISDVQT